MFDVEIGKGAEDFEPCLVLGNTPITKMTKSKDFFMIKNEYSPLALTYEFVRFFKSSAEVSVLARNRCLLVIFLAFGAAFLIASF